MAVNASTTVDTTLVEGSAKVIYGIDAHSANVTLTLPDAALIAGREFMIFANADPGSYYIKVTATGGDKIGSAGGATTLISTDAACGLTLVSDGTSYGVVGSYGTWS